ncbi:hypothetical protein [Streptomyces sp. cg35]|uniref:hypothetical protein n=1 Tax=Streptomyces sp. cg35 TaxID=3421650 RepID=UPI003D17372E
MNSTDAPCDPAAVDWEALRGRRVVLDNSGASEEDERPGGDAARQGVVSEVRVAGDDGTVELTLTRYDGRTLVVRPVGRFIVTDDDTGTVLYAPAAPTKRLIPRDFVETVRHVAPERAEDLERMGAADLVDELPAHEAQALVEIAAQVEWECTRERDLLEDPASPAARYAEAARSVVRAWAVDAGTESTG